MSLYVNLLMPSEQRSASVLNAKALLRITGITLPVVLLLIVGTSLVRLMILKNDLAMQQTVWEELEPRKKDALQRQAAFAANRDVRDELAGWADARLQWHEVLLRIQKAIPPTMQLASLSVAQDMPLIDKKTPARAFRLSLSGKATGPSSEADIQMLRGVLDRMEEIDAAKVSNFGAARDPSADLHDRVFQIDCRFKPRTFR